MPDARRQAGRNLRAVSDIPDRRSAVSEYNDDLEYDLQEAVEVEQ